MMEMMMNLGNSDCFESVWCQGMQRDEGWKILFEFGVEARGEKNVEVAENVWWQGMQRG
jgi:hypothetical protein